MKLKEMDRINDHYCKYFEQADGLVLHPLFEDKVHIDGILYEPTEKYPFWKLCSMGASDIKMPGRNPLGNRNEYMMFIDPSVDMKNHEICSYFYAYMLEIAMYTHTNRAMLSYGHFIDWPTDEGEEMAGAFIELPQVISDIGILRCKLSSMKTAICLQIVLLNKAEIASLEEMGPEAFSNYLYPEDGGQMHFLCEIHRSDKF